MNTRRLPWLLSVCTLINVSLLRSLSANAQTPGALLQVTLSSTVGVVLDDIPAVMRDTVAASYLKMPTTFWKDRATMQIEHTTYRLIYPTSSTTNRRVSYRCRLMTSGRSRSMRRARSARHSKAMTRCSSPTSSRRRSSRM